MANRLFNATQPMRYTDVLTCARSKPTFYRVEDPMHPRARNESKVWLTKSRGAATCSNDGSPVVTVTREGRRVNLCTSCLGGN